MKPWFLGSHPKRLDDELQALERAGYKYELDLAHKASGRIVLIVEYPLDDVIHELLVVYPDNYPYFPFDISSKSFPDGKHKDPFSGALCILQNPHTNWRVDDTLAAFLNTQIPKISVAHQAPQDAALVEAHEAAQITGYFQYEPGSAVFTGDWHIPENVDRGTILIGIDRYSDPNTVMRGAVLEVQGSDQSALATIDDRLRNHYGKPIKGRWLRLPHPPKSSRPDQILSEVIKVWPNLKSEYFNHGPDVIGILMPEEVQYKQHHENWIFLVRRKRKSPKGIPEIHASLARSDQASTQSVQARAPRTAPLIDKKVFIVGLGSIGSIIAWQLARAGIKTMRLVDFDFVQIGNTPRWLLGWPAAGHSKAQAITQYLHYHYPLTDVQSIDHRIGSNKQISSNFSDLEALPEGLAGADLIIDATAEWCVSHFLSDLSKEKGIPYLWATGTPGSWGGTVGRVIPGKTQGCWKCYQRKLTDQSIKTPNQEISPSIQPVGCFHPTFTGTGFDMDQVSLSAVRLAVSTLCVDKEGGYPDFNWDVGIVDLWNEQGMPIAPEWHTYKLTKHPECDCNGN